MKQRTVSDRVEERRELGWALRLGERKVRVYIVGRKLGFWKSEWRESRWARVLGKEWGN